jgi:cell division septation protein DedD
MRVAHASTRVGRGALHTTCRVCLLAATAFAFAACQGSGDVSLAAASSAYRAAEYGRSLTMARALSARSTGLDQDRARYLEGLSSLALGKPDDAIAPLAEAAEAADRALAADARISLGTAYATRGDLGSAADSYRRAGTLLEGAERERALETELALRARVRERDAAREREPRPSPTSRVAEDAPPSPRGAAPDVVPSPSSPTAVIVNGMELEPTRFAIQAGAFRDRAKADSVAGELRARVAVERLRAPRVCEKRRPDGSTVYVVQFGDFENRTLAGRALMAFPRSGYTVERHCIVSDRD